MNDRLVGMYQEVLRRDFNAFNHRAFLELVPQTTFLPNWHLEVLGAALEDVRQGRTKRLIINLPPRHLKSLTASVAFPAYLLGHDPAAQILCVSYAQDLADKHARDCRTLIQSPFYQTLFPTRLSLDRQAVGEFVTSAGGFRFSTSVGGVLTGRGADYIIIDDAQKADEALSDVRRRAVNEWIDNTLYSRLNSKETGAIIVVMQRLHEDDLVGHVTQQEGWRIISFPAIAVEAETFLITTPYGPRIFRRREGDILHPERESRETLEVLRKTLGSASFAAQYQQSPTPREGLMVKAAWFPRYAATDLPARFDYVLLSCDTANKVSELSDYTALTVWGIDDKHAYLLNVVRRRMEYPDLKRTIREIAQLCKAGVILIEDRASGTQLIQELKVEGLDGITAYAPEGDKQMRLYAQTAMMEAGLVHLPTEAPWLDAYINELTGFPNGRHDDQVDSTSQALTWIKQPSSAWTWIRYMRQEVCRQRGEDRPDVILVAPIGISHVYLDSA